MNINKYLNQTAIYWANPQPDGLGGYTYDVPIDVPVRWTVKQEKFLSGSFRSFLDNTVVEQVSKVFVLANRQFDMGGRMQLGSLLDEGSSGSDPPTAEALTIEGHEVIPDKRANKFIIKVWLV